MTIALTYSHSVDEATEHGRGPVDRPSRRHRRTREPLRELQDRHGQQQPANLPVDNYSTSTYYHYDSVARQNGTRAHVGGTQRLERPLGGDWKYVSDLKDATLAPKYPREERKPLDAAAAYKYKMYPYDQSFKTAYSQAAAPVGGSRTTAAAASTPHRSHHRDQRDRTRHEPRDVVERRF